MMIDLDLLTEIERRREGNVVSLGAVS